MIFFELALFCEKFIFLQNHVYFSSEYNLIFLKSSIALGANLRDSTVGRELP